jgi:hypothetical protein
MSSHERRDRPGSSWTSKHVGILCQCRGDEIQACSSQWAQFDHMLPTCSNLTASVVLAGSATSEMRRESKQHPPGTCQQPSLVCRDPLVTAVQPCGASSPRASIKASALSAPLAGKGTECMNVDLKFLQQCGKYVQTKLPWQQQNAQLRCLLQQLRRGIGVDFAAEDVVMAILPAVTAARSGTQNLAMECLRVRQQLMCAHSCSMRVLL